MIEREDRFDGLHEDEKNRRQAAKAMELSRKKSIEEDEQARKLERQKRMAVSRRLDMDDEHEDPEARHWASRLRV
jgi:hypothetical protein